MRIKHASAKHSIRTREDLSHPVYIADARGDFLSHAAPCTDSYFRRFSAGPWRRCAYWREGACDEGRRRLSLMCLERGPQARLERPQETLRCQEGPVCLTRRTVRPDWLGPRERSTLRQTAPAI